PLPCRSDRVRWRRHRRASVPPLPFPSQPFQHAKVSAVRRQKWPRTKQGRQLAEGLLPVPAYLHAASACPPRNAMVNPREIYHAGHVVRRTRILSLKIKPLPSHRESRGCGKRTNRAYSTVTDLARLRG